MLTSILSLKSFKRPNFYQLKFCLLSIFLGLKMSRVEHVKARSDEIIFISEFDSSSK